MSKEVIIQNLEKSNYINREISSRNLPSGPINMNFFPNPSTTKYEKFINKILI